MISFSEYESELVKLKAVGLRAAKWELLVAGDSSTVGDGGAKKFDEFGVAEVVELFSFDFGLVDKKPLKLFDLERDLGSRF
jgi:hypothetical protein